MTGEGPIRDFVLKEFRDCSDLSALTLRILRARYLKQVGEEALSSEQRTLMKRIVEEELLKMKDSDSSDDEPLSWKIVSLPSNDSKRKREEDDEEEAEKGQSQGKSARKKSCVRPSPPDSPDSGIERVGQHENLKEGEEDGSIGQAGAETSEDEEKSPRKTAAKQSGRDDSLRRKERSKVTSESKEDLVSTKRGRGKMEVPVVEGEEDEISAERKSEEDEALGRGKCSAEDPEHSSDSEEEHRGKRRGGEAQNRHLAQRGRAAKSRRAPSDSESDGESRQEVTQETKARRGLKQVRSPSGSKGGGEGEGRRGEGRKESDLSSDEEESGGKDAKKEKKKRGAGSESDSSSLPSLEEEEVHQPKSGPEKKIKQKKRGDGKGSSGTEEEHKAVSRLKRYIALCGVRRNYKKLLEGCRSVKAKVAVLRRELEELGVTGQPSIEKCKRARLKREEAQELADLDMSNIISTQGRPKRRAASVWPPPRPVSPPPSSYKRTVSSESGSEEDESRDGAQRRGPDWSQLKGIISDDAESD
ncbi:hypothetical protein GJAV_G00214780 [Gymnothorax javanicus]|nr:hypothetical protein GJAV_G00214780 [Gymnothorax javanicus]